MSQLGSVDYILHDPIPVDNIETMTERHSYESDLSHVIYGILSMLAAIGLLLGQLSGQDQLFKEYVTNQANKKPRSVSDD
ncbi:hypothetical protein T265_01119 [Opisthorchis viverrini]|uniref:Uncharacterized protein n=1 Tax=Opisthorchis viverrini TaxID=6198 RepID=A0A075A3I3_OPIVI|nr:hypothetical protein T265_01119 [Opisthorchis viverrini]KER32822.1 hypothetical protein T265_01119 [Opisthorchis viverrini]